MGRIGRRGAGQSCSLHGRGKVNHGDMEVTHVRTRAAPASAGSGAGLCDGLQQHWRRTCQRWPCWPFALIGLKRAGFVRRAANPADSTNLGKERGMSARMPLMLIGLLVVSVAGCKSSGARSESSGGCCRGKSDLATGPRAKVPMADPVSAGLPAIDPGSSSGVPVTYGGQKTCPVMGEELGSMGSAIPVTVKGQAIYVCCRGCATRVQRDPDAYLPRVEAERAKPRSEQ